ncbi:MAG: TlyA family RNA methyltransferase, partial [Parvularculaceae bacterium]|nr:TlyA family RNA methyltransferase [Parvularculaceae bacterium]
MLNTLQLHEEFARVAGERTRLDLWLVANRRFASRARARAAIDAGLVMVDGATASRASMTVSAGSEITIAGDVHDYVSRGGVKLAAALDAFAIDPSGRICLDLGASTGGFSDVLLRRGASKIYAVDVGTDQLHAQIAADKRVVNLQKTHAKDLTPRLVLEPVSLVVCDVSFISIIKALPPALALTTDDAKLAVLFKPQFELGREHIGKGGLVTADDTLVAARLGEFCDWLAGRGWTIIGTIDSPIIGGDGNREY